jgi:hypothetical protein
VAALAFAMRQNLEASSLAQLHGTRVRPAIEQMHGAAVGWSLGFTALQIASFLVVAFVLRTAWAWRSAVCYTVAAMLLILADSFGLFCLLVWLRITLGAA